MTAVQVTLSNGTKVIGTDLDDCQGVLLGDEDIVAVDIINAETGEVICAGELPEVEPLYDGCLGVVIDGTYCGTIDLKKGALEDHKDTVDEIVAFFRSQYEGRELGFRVFVQSLVEPYDTIIEQVGRQER